MSGTLFEAIGQDVLPEGLNITLLPMVQLTRKPNPSMLVLKPHVSVKQNFEDFTISSGDCTCGTTPQWSDLDRGQRGGSTPSGCCTSPEVYE